MGRTFGLLIVSIGLWLVVSLPTREPALDQQTRAPLRTEGNAVAVAGAQGTRVMAPESGVTSASATAISRRDAALMPTPASSQPSAHRPPLASGVAGPAENNVVRAKRGQDDRAVAARSREIEAEPEAPTARPPEPVEVALNTAQGRAVAAAPQQGLTTQGTVPAGAVRTAALASAPDRPFVPAPSAFDPRLLAASGEPVSAQARPMEARPVKVIVPSLGTTASNAELAGATASAHNAAAIIRRIPDPAISRVQTQPITGAGAVAPGIVDSIRRNLASAPQAQAARSAGPPVLPAERPAAERPVAEKPRTGSRLAAAVHNQDAGAVQENRLAMPDVARRASPTPADAGESEKPTPKAAVLAKPVAGKKTPRAIALGEQPPAPWPQPRMRVTQNYAPPTYLGRVVIRNSPPPAVFIPSSGNYRRSQFRSDTLWDSIRRQGM